MFEIEKQALERNRTMAFCGYREDLARAEGIRAALAILQDGKNRTQDEDLRACERFQAALQYIEVRTAETSLCGQIRRSLSIPRQEERRYTFAHLIDRLIVRQGDPVFRDLPGMV